MRSSGRKIAPSRRSGPGSNIRSGSSSGCLARQGALSRAQQEHPPSAGDLRFCQFVHRAPPPAALPGGVACLHHACKLRKHPSASPNRGPTTLYYCQLRKFSCLSSKRGPLVQTFPSAELKVRIHSDPAKSRPRTSRAKSKSDGSNGCDEAAACSARVLACARIGLRTREGGPEVRIPFPPAESRLQTRDRLS